MQLKTGYNDTTTMHAGSDLALSVLAAAAGLTIGWLDLHTTEVIVTVVPLVVTGVLFGVLRPRAAWRWAVLVGLGLPVMAAVARVTRIRTAEPVHLDLRIALVALAFALLGSYTGAWVGRAARGSRGGGLPVARSSPARVRWRRLTRQRQRSSASRQ